MLSLTDNILLSIVFGTLLSGLVVFVFYLIAEAIDIKMSGKSMVLSIVMLSILLYQFSNVAAGFSAKSDVSDSYSYIKIQYNGDISTLEAISAKQMILALHPNLENLIERLDANNYNSSEQYFKDMHSILNHNILESFGWILGTILICGIPAILFGKTKETTIRCRRRRNTERRQHVRSRR